MDLFKHSPFKAFVATSAIGLLLFAGGCTPPASTHPGQLNALDGQTYDSLLVAHSALTGLSAQIASTYPQFKTEFNLAAQSYDATYNGYLVFRSAPTANQADLTAEVATLTSSVISLTAAFQAALGQPAPKAMIVKAHAAMAPIAKQNVNLATILEYLEIAAAVARSIPGAAPAAALAQLIITAVQQALVSVQSANGKPIDLTLIAPVATL